MSLVDKTRRKNDKIGLKKRRNWSERRQSRRKKSVTVAAQRKSDTKLAACFFRRKTRNRSKRKSDGGSESGRATKSAKPASEKGDRLNKVSEISIINESIGKTREPAKKSE